MSTENSNTQVNVVDGISYYQIQKNQLSADQVAEQELQDTVEENWLQLNADIKESARELRDAKKTRISLLKSKNVNWSSVVSKDGEIERRKAGLKALKAYRDSLFPAGSVTKSEDQED